MVRASRVPDLSPTSGTDADWYFWGGIYFWHAGRSRNSETQSHRSWADSAGNIYVNSNGFSAQGRIWESCPLQVRFAADGSYGFYNSWIVPDADPGADAVDVFTKHEHFVMKDYSSGQRNGI